MLKRRRERKKSWERNDFYSSSKQPKQGGLNSLRHFFRCFLFTILLIRKIILWTLAGAKQIFVFCLLLLRLRWLKIFHSKKLFIHIVLDVFKNISSNFFFFFSFFFIASKTFDGRVDFSLMSFFLFVVMEPNISLNF